MTLHSYLSRSILFSRLIFFLIIFVTLFYLSNTDLIRLFHQLRIILLGWFSFVLNIHQVSSLIETLEPLAC